MTRGRPASAGVDWEAKIRAFLHDPPHKAICLAQRVGHGTEAARLGRALGVESAAFLPVADHLASAADRPRGLEDARVDWLAEPIICRPTGGRVAWAEAELDASLRGLDARAMTGEIEGCLAGLAALDPRERFHALWRLLPELLARTRAGRPLSEKVGPWWRVLPADTRIPDHSIWSHARVVSAFQGALPGPALLEVRLGPVQSFIRSARRTRDLWAASWLLSYLAAAAAWAVALEVGADAVIFPDLHGQPLVDFWLRRALGGAVEGVGELPDAVPAAASFPNRLVALVPAAQAKGVGSRALEAVRGKMDALTAMAEKIARSAVAGLGGPSEAWAEHWRRAVEGFPEAMWVAVELPDDAGEPGFEELLTRAEDWAGARDLAAWLRRSAGTGRYAPNPGLAYPAAYRLLQTAMEARRTLRGFAQWQAEGERCTVCGDRPALPLADPGAGREAQRDTWRRFADSLRERAGSVWVALDGREMLCGLCLVRRAIPELVPEVEQAGWEGDKPRFPSTSSVATACWRERLEERGAADPRIGDALDDLERAAESSGAAGEMPLYPSRRTLGRLDGRALVRPDVGRLEEEYGDRAGDLARAGEELLRRARSAIGAPPTYYAVLAMDGDRMGRWLSGHPETSVRLADVVHPAAPVHLGPGDRAPLGPSRHAGLSAAVRDFSLLGVPGIVRQGRGALVYAGGDDVLALVPVETVFETALRLRVGFTEGGAGDGRAAWVPGDPDRPDRPPPGLSYWVGTGRVTASAGIAIAHHLTDLRTVIEAAVEMEQRAKAEAGRDALAVAVLKRSGERREAIWPWFLEDGGAARAASAPAVVGAWRDAFARAGGLSPAILADLEAEGAVGALPEPAVRGRLLFLLGRHAGRGMGNHEVDRLAEGLLAIRRSLVGRGWAPDRAWGPAGCLGLVAVAAFVARGGRE